MLDSHELEEHYRNLPDDKIEQVCLYEARDLRPEVLPILRVEVARRGLATALVEAIDIHAHGLSQVEFDAVVDWIRKRPCPICGREDELLNACVVEAVRSAVVVSEVRQELIVGCPDCLAGRLRAQSATTGLSGLLGGGFGVFHAARATNRNRRALEETRQPGPSAALLEYVRANIAPLALERRRACAAGQGPGHRGENQPR